MGFVGGLIAMAIAVVLLFLLKAKNGVEKPFARNWMALITATMAIMVMFIGGLAAVLSNWS
jgi:multisubunit Na+/H+ antiporter MnhB subunit